MVYSVMSKFLAFITLIVMTSNLYSALPPWIQKERDLEMMSENLQLQRNSSIVLLAKVLKKEERIPLEAKSKRHSYRKSIILTIKPIKVIRNRHDVKIKNVLHVSYSVIVANGMVGPKIYNTKIAQEKQNYIFYFNDDLALSASNYSIDTENSELKQEAIDAY